MKEKIIIGTRGSILAVAQSEMVKKILESNFPEYEFELKIIVTSGDKDLVSNWNNSQNSLKSFFTKEIEKELLTGEIQIAVHSMKDMPIVSPEGLICGAIPKREDNRDVFISRDGKLLSELPKNAIIGTSSLRRTMGLKEIREDFNIKQLRGNIHTRLKKLENGEYDGIILAAAGLKRVGLEERISQYLSYDEMMPAPAQGALYIQCNENNLKIKEMLNKINDSETEKLVMIEREFSKIFDGGCHTPMGCTTELIDDKVILKGVYCKDNRMYRGEIIGAINDGIELAHKLACQIREKIDGK